MYKTVINGEDFIFFPNSNEVKFKNNKIKLDNISNLENIMVDFELASLALKSDLPEKLLYSLLELKDENADIELALAERNDIPKSIMLLLAGSEHPEVRESIIDNRKVLPVVIILLSCDKIELIHKKAFIKLKNINWDNNFKDIEDSKYVVSDDYNGNTYIDSILETYNYLEKSVNSKDKKEKIREIKQIIVENYNF